MNKKVYCQNCKHSYMDDRSPLMCNNRVAEKGCGFLVSNKYSKIGYCETIQKKQNDQCGFYKRKWYKFWVK